MKSEFPRGYTKKTKRWKIGKIRKLKDQSRGPISDYFLGIPGKTEGSNYQRSEAGIFHIEGHESSE